MIVCKVDNASWHLDLIIAAGAGTAPVTPSGCLSFKTDSWYILFNFILAMIDITMQDHHFHTSNNPTSSSSTTITTNYHPNTDYSDSLLLWSSNNNHCQRHPYSHLAATTGTVPAKVTSFGCAPKMCDRREFKILNCSSRRINERIARRTGGWILQLSTP